MKILKPLNLTLAFAVAGILAASVSSAQAGFSFRHHDSINCFNYNSDSSPGETVFGCNVRSGGTSGDYSSSYNCNTYFLNYGFCDINFNNNRDCNYQGDCTIVFKCSDGKTYSCDIKNWDGRTQIKCYNLPKDFQRDCQDIYICKPKCNTPPTCVPEPSTIVAGALLLIPFGISTARILRKNKNLPTT